MLTKATQRKLTNANRAAEAMKAKGVAEEHIRAVRGLARSYREMTNAQIRLREENRSLRRKLDPELALSPGWEEREATAN